MRLRRSMTLARYVFALTAGAFLLSAFVRAWNEARGRALPSPLSMTTGSVAILIGIRCAVLSWVELFERAESKRTLAYYFVVSQLGKYIPGGFWQFVGQVGFASEAGATIARATSALPVHLLVQAAAGGTLGAFAGVLLPSAPPIWRAIALASVSLVVLLNRSILTGAVRLGRQLGVAEAVGGDIPSQLAILRSYGWATATLLCSGTAFALLLSSVDPASPRVPCVAVFAIAWLVRFLAVPVPAGLGVREAVMLAFLPTSAGGIVVASLCHRLLVMAAESTVILVARARLK